QTGSGSNHVHVLGTTGALYEYNRGGNNTTVIGTLGSTSAVRGEVHVNGDGATSLIVDESADTASLAVDLYDGSIAGLAPALIYYSPSSASTGGVIYLGLLGSNGGSVYNVHNTSRLYDETYLQTGTGSDTVNVLGTTGFLYDYSNGGFSSTNIGSSG